MKKQGVKFQLSTKVVSSEVTAEGVKLTVEPSGGGAASVLAADVVLVSTGRRPFTRNIGLEALGIETVRPPALSLFPLSLPYLLAL